MLSHKKILLVTLLFSFTLNAFGQKFRPGLGAGINKSLLQFSGNDKFDELLYNTHGSLLYAAQLAGRYQDNPHWAFEGRIGISATGYTFNQYAFGSLPIKGTTSVRAYVERYDITLNTEYIMPIIGGWKLGLSGGLSAGKSGIKGMQYKFNLAQANDTVNDMEFRFRWTSDSTMKYSISPWVGVSLLREKKATHYALRLECMPSLIKSQAIGQKNEFYDPQANKTDVFEQRILPRIHAVSLKLFIYPRIGFKKKTGNHN